MNMTLIRIGWLNLKRDYVALGLTFILPIVFFSIFASIFSGMGADPTSGDDGGMHVIVVDQDQSDVSLRFINAIDNLDALNVVTSPSGEIDANGKPALYDRETARQQVREGKNPAAIIIPPGFGETFPSFGGNQSAVEIIHDAANPIALHTISGLLQAAAMTAAPDQQQSAIDQIRPYLKGERPWEELDDANDEMDSDTDSGGNGFAGLVTVTATPAQANEEDDTPPNMTAYYAAGIGVMFLLFSMAGAGGSLLEEEERGTLERLLTSRVTMSSLLLSNWLFFAAIGFLQLLIMFIWGWLMFDLDLWQPKQFSGFLIMTVFTALAAAAFGIVLATLCRSRAQLAGISTIVILIMSALGGSMVPRFVAGDLFDLTSPFTFNGWALDGYLQVFWYTNPADSMMDALVKLWPTLLVLIAMTVAFLAIARLLARRWEVA